MRQHPLQPPSLQNFLFMRHCKGRVMTSINDHPEIRRVFEGFHFETLDIRYSNTNQRQGVAEW
jgi:DNA adenine methylase